ncbi:hypothetical protein NDU88_001428 [Pleurodeles waltl]|uniref:Uncharacterized protein n=1 Tax=Pleurodeles waltl TaxID=8319 RepID=A0AAV7UUQ2_PLEWA|nr:hypothetical protein NDU88_001428 [Pleurodeles waltl]
MLAPRLACGGGALQTLLEASESQSTMDYPDRGRAQMGHIDSCEGCTTLGQIAALNGPELGRRDEGTVLGLNCGLLEWISGVQARADFWALLDWHRPLCRAMPSESPGTRKSWAAGSTPEIHGGMPV